MQKKNCTIFGKPCINQVRTGRQMNQVLSSQQMDRVLSCAWEHFVKSDAWIECKNTLRSLDQERHGLLFCTYRHTGIDIKWTENPAIVVATEHPNVAKEMLPDHWRFVLDGNEYRFPVKVVAGYVNR